MRNLLLNTEESRYIYACLQRDQMGIRYTLPVSGSFSEFLTFPG